MTVTTIYDAATRPGAAVKSDVFTVTSAGVALRIKGTALAAFRAKLEFSEGGQVAYRGSTLVLSSTSNVALLVQPGDYRFDIANPDGDIVTIEART